MSALARAAGLTKSTLSKILSPTKVSKYPQADTLHAIAAALGTTVDYLERGIVAAPCGDTLERALDAHEFDADVDVEIADRVVRDVRSEAAAMSPAANGRSVPVWRLRIEQLTRAAVGSKKVERATSHTRARKR